MMLVKQAAVYVNIMNCRLKKHLGEVFKKNGINLTAEQFLVMDTLWNEGALTQQNIAYIIQKDKNSVTQFIDNLEIFSLLANVADVKSLVIHPASTTHSQLTDEELADQGIKQNTIRLSIGTEHIDDIIADLENGFAAI